MYLFISAMLHPDYELQNTVSRNPHWVTVGRCEDSLGLTLHTFKMNTSVIIAGMSKKCTGYRGWTTATQRCLHTLLTHAYNGSQFHLLSSSKYCTKEPIKNTALSQFKRAQLKQNQVNPLTWKATEVLSGLKMERNGQSCATIQDYALS